ncbi:MAG TPA: AbrB/MazE/SpoVT family DNA-binding domain-containing protein [Candidatus Brocadiaceae bacterium]|nr:AbrB/MazE/SpoVT family DNA-binding domain-containing protein [Candidatus Brocadiaceae bacterium]
MLIAVSPYLSNGGSLTLNYIISRGVVVTVTKGNRNERKSQQTVRGRIHLYVPEHISEMGTKITSKGQITLPKEVRKLLNVQEGNVIVFENENDKIVIKPARTCSSIASIAHYVFSFSFNLEHND